MKKLTPSLSNLLLLDHFSSIFIFDSHITMKEHLNYLIIACSIFVNVQAENQILNEN